MGSALRSRLESRLGRLEVEVGIGIGVGIGVVVEVRGSGGSANQEAERARPGYTRGSLPAGQGAKCSSSVPNRPGEL